MNRENKSVGLKEIASELNISVTAVSRALRDCCDISIETKEKVRSLAAKYNYSPKKFVESTKATNRKTVTFVVDNLASPYFGMILNIMTRKFQAKGINSLILPSTAGHLKQSLVEECLKQGSCAIITFIEPTKDSVKFARDNNIHLYLFGRYSKEDIDCFYTDDKQGGSIAADYLHSLKCKKLLYLGAPSISCDIDRFEGFKEEINRLGLLPATYVPDYELGSLLTIIKEGYDGIFAFNDELACRALNLIGKSQEKFEKKFNIIGYDGLSKTLEYPFDITSIISNYDEMATDAYRLVVMRMNKEDIEVKTQKRKYPVCIFVGRTYKNED